VAVQAQDDLLVDLPDEDHLGHLDCVLVRYAQPADKLDGHAEALHVEELCPAAAVHHDRIQANVLEQHDVARELLAQGGSSIAAPPYLMTMVFEWNSLM